MNTTEFQYTTYIKSTPEQVWAAITTPEFARQYWGNGNHSDWKPGSRWVHATDAGKVIVAGQVQVSDRPRRLVLSWGAPDEEQQPEKHSRATFVIEAIGDMVCLRVTHEQLVAGSEVAKRVAAGWPRVLSSLKSILETGTALATWTDFEHQCAGAAH